GYINCQLCTSKSSFQLFRAELNMTKDRMTLVAGAILALTAFGCLQAMRSKAAPPANPPATTRPADAIADAQTPRLAPSTRPEQQKNAHDQSNVFSALNAEPSSTAFKQQPDEGKIKGFEFYRDPLNAKRPMQTFGETMAQDAADKPKITAQHLQLLATRYDLTPHFDPQLKMTRGKPICVGPTAKLPAGVD